MPNLYRIDAPASELAATFEASAGADPWAGGYVAPGKFGPVVTGEGARRRIGPMLWGMPPPPNVEWKSERQLVTSARNLDSPFWFGTLRHAALRCLLPATRFQAWSGEAGAKREHWFSVPGQPVFAFAGIWRDDEIPRYVVLTTEPNALVAPIHAKAMPVILHPEDYGIWLNAEWKAARRLVEPYPSQLMAVEAIA